ncbi:MAG: exodeoxyribonuclease VII small subunit [Christensenellales bacterium]|jgi:exodeoxyribonuclease VII small subunit
MSNKSTANEVSKEIKESLTFEQMLSALEEIVSKLEAGGLSLEDSLAAYEQSVLYSKELSRMLDAGEKRIMELSSKGAEKPFTAEDLT